MKNLSRNILNRNKRKEEDLFIYTHITHESTHILGTPTHTFMISKCLELPIVAKWMVVFDPIFLDNATRDGKV